ncbi:hypothetical protein [Saccharothrix deserti]|uniref:hypothetical protein n=1 Tax=Saccharothrix deserti TaxID=2593674 RepID=UPI00131C810A|nr:hypothetical protein [Saccharothrix deserti]
MDAFGVGVATLFPVQLQRLLPHRAGLLVLSKGDLGDACGATLAAPYSAHLGGGPAVVGILFAAYSTGCAAASLAVAALPEPVQLRLMPLLAIGTGVPLLGCLFDPPLTVVVGLFVLSGAASSYHVIAQPTFVLRTPDAHRGQTVGFAITAMQARVPVSPSAALLPNYSTHTSSPAQPAPSVSWPQRSWQRAGEHSRTERDLAAINPGHFDVPSGRVNRIRAINTGR